MNAKLAKKLRRQAEAMTVGRPEREYEHHKFSAVAFVPTRMNTGSSTRGVYRVLKQEARRDRHR